MTEQEYREKVIEKIGALENAINLLVEKINFLETKFDQNLELAEGRMKGRTELLEQEINGVSTRIGEKLEEHKISITQIEVAHKDLACECVEKRKEMHQKIDDNHDSIITIQTYQKIMWGIFGAVGVGLIALIADMITRILP